MKRIIILFFAVILSWQASGFDKVIKYPKNDYAVECMMQGKMVAEQQPILIYKLSDGATIINGVVQKSSTILKVSGTWKSEFGNMKGTFIITNTNNKSFSLKPKESSGLAVSVRDIDDYTTTYKGLSVTIAKDYESPTKNYSLILYDSTEQNKMAIEFSLSRFVVLSLYNDISSLLLSAENARIFHYNDSYSFVGKVEQKQNGGYVDFIQKEGTRTYKKGPYSEVKIEKFTTMYSVTRTYSDYYSRIKSETAILNTSVFEKIQWWNIDEYYNNAETIKIAYSNGDSFTGKSIMVNGKVTPQTGVYQYANGDKFKGNMESKAAGDIFIDGTTTFADGHQSVSGNWLEEYQLTTVQLSDVSNKKYPSEKRKYAREKQYLSYVSNGDRALEAKKYEEAKQWYTLAINLTTGEENSLKNRLENIDDKLRNVDGTIEKMLNETIRTESIKKGNDKYVVEYTRVGYRLTGYDDKGRKKFEYENKQNENIDLKTWNMEIPHHGKMIKYSYNSRGVLTSRKYYNENQSYYLVESQRDDGSFHCEGIYENSGEFIDDILIDVGYDSGIWAVQYPIYRNNPRTGEKSQIATIYSEKELKKWMLDYLYKLY